MDTREKLKELLETFVAKIRSKSEQVNRAVWLLETTESEDAAFLLATLEAELKILYSDPTIYDKLTSLDQDESITNPLLKRVLNVLIRSFKSNMLPEEMIKEISTKEALLSQAYGTFRPTFEGKKVSENDLLDILKNENDIDRRKRTWAASKEIGNHLAPQILKIVKLRNNAAHRLGYSDYYSMQLELQEVDKKWLLSIFNELAEASQEAYRSTLNHINAQLANRYKVPIMSLGPWAWSDPFCQEDPLASDFGFDNLLEEIDTVKVCQDFYHTIRLHIKNIIPQSDLFERQNKNQHAFCLHLDRYDDVRILANIRPSFRWLDTMLHELGHGVYDLGYDPQLPWILRDPPHMITTEAMALIAGRQAYDPRYLQAILPNVKGLEKILRQIKESQNRRQLLFSRWVMVMVHFEANLYANPEQDLNALWWSLVQKYQGICPPARIEQNDWATKYHIGLAPVYYHSYLLGEMFASMLQETLFEITNTTGLYGNEKVGAFLQEKLFRPGNRFSWNKLIQYCTQKELEGGAWLREFATPKL